MLVIRDEREYANGEVIDIIFLHDCDGPLPADGELTSPYLGEPPF